MPAIRYRLVIKGALGALSTSAFDDMEVESTGATTTLIGVVRDQAQLLGLVERVASLGLTLVSIAPADPA